MYMAADQGVHATAGWVLGARHQYPMFGLATELKPDPTFLVSNVPMYTATWHHLAATYDGVTMSLFLDGVKVRRAYAQRGEIRYPHHEYYKPQVGEHLFTLGAFHDANEYNPMTGLLTDVRVWKIVRSQEEINKYRFKDILGKETGLLHCWRFFEDTWNPIKFKNQVPDHPDADSRGDVVRVAWDGPKNKEIEEAGRTKYVEKVKIAAADPNLKFGEDAKHS